MAVVVNRRSQIGSRLAVTRGLGARTGRRWPSKGVVFQTRRCHSGAQKRVFAVPEKERVAWNSKVSKINAEIRLLDQCRRCGS